MRRYKSGTSAGSACLFNAILKIVEAVLHMDIDNHVKDTRSEVKPDVPILCIGKLDDAGLPIVDVKLYSDLLKLDEVVQTSAYPCQSE